MKEVFLGFTQVVLLVLFVLGCIHTVDCLAAESFTEFIFMMVPRVVVMLLCGHYFCVIEARTPKKEEYYES